MTNRADKSKEQVTWCMLETGIEEGLWRNNSAVPCVESDRQRERGGNSRLVVVVDNRPWKEEGKYDKESGRARNTNKGVPLLSS